MKINIAPVTNSEDWYEEFNAVDEDTETAFDFTGWTLTLNVRKENHSRSLVTASTTDGKITFPAGRDSGQFVLNVPYSTMKTLCEGDYQVGLVMEKDGTRFQFLLGSLPVLNGVVE